MEPSNAFLEEEHMIGIYAVLGALGALAVALLIVLLGMLSAQKKSRMEDDARRQEQKTEQEAIKEKLIKLETLASNPAQLDTLHEINKRLESTTNLFGDIRKDLGAMQEAAKGMQDIGKSISTFQELLLSPKVRGGFGEILLNDLIKDVLPEAHYEFQYSFRDGTKVDAVIKTEDRIIPIDAKFPLEEFQRMSAEGVDEEAFEKRFIQILKPRVTEVKRYINPNENTTNFALMYIPSEKIYSKLSGMDNLMTSLRRSRVFPVSPSTFYQFLETILLGLRGLAIEKEAQQILDSLNRIAREFEAAQSDWEIVGKHITNARGKYDEVAKRLERIGDNIKALEIRSEKGQKEIPL